MILDQDDVYTQYDAFSTLYNISEKNNIDILGFSFVYGFNNLTLTNRLPKRFLETPILFQPKVIEMDHNISLEGRVKRMNWFIWNYFIRSDLFKKSIKQINEKYMETKMFAHDDFMLFFILVRNARNIKLIKRIFYAQIINSEKNYPNIKKSEIKEIALCNSYLNYIEYVLMKTNNTIQDKKIASFELKQWFLNHNCRNNIKIYVYLILNNF